MSQYTTYFNSPIQVGKAPDNIVGTNYNTQSQVTGYVGDVVLSQLVTNIPITVGGTNVWAILPPGSDLIAIDFIIPNGVQPTAGAISVFPAQGDGTSPGTAQAVTLSTSAFDTSVVFGASLANVFLIGTAWRIQFNCTTAVTFAGTTPPSIFADVRYCIRR